MNQLTARIKHFAVVLLLFSFSYSASAQLQADFIMDRTGGCSPLTVNFTNRTFGASASAVYKWDFGNTNTSSLLNPGAIYKDEKAYTVTLTVIDNGRTSSKTATVTVYKKPSVDFSVNAPKLCMPSAAIFNVTGSAGDGNLSNFYWDFGDGSTQQGYGNQVSHNYNYVQKPTISLTVTNSYGCNSSVTKSNIVEIMPAMQPAFVPEKNIYCLTTDNVQFTNNSAGPGTLSYSWDFGDGNTSSVKNAAHVYNKKGLYNVRMTMTNTDGCSASTSYNPLNIAYFNTDFSNTPLCRELSFASSSYISPNSSFWEFGNGSTSNSYYNTRHVYPAAGSYTVKLTNTYGSCTESVSKAVEVKDLVAFNSNFSTPPLLCKGNSYSFASTSSTNPSASTWEFSDGFTASWTNMSRVFSQPGSYNIKLTNTFGTCKEEVSKTIVVNDVPEPKGFIADMGGACGSPVTVQFKDTTAGAVAWQWTLDYVYPSGNVHSSSQTPSYRYNSDGSYLASLTVTNAAGCSRAVSKYIYVYRPSVNIFYNYTSSPRGHYDCDSLIIKFATNSNVPLVAYQWNFGDGSFSTEANPQHAYYQQGTYNVSLNYTTESGCKGTAYYQTGVYPKPKADFNFTIPCGNSLDLQFRDASFFSDNWNWNFQNANWSYYGGATPVYRYSDTGKYMVKFVSHIGHCSDTVTREIYANVLPSSVSILKADKTCNGTRGTVVFDQKSVRATGLTWNFGDGTTIPYDTSQHTITHSYTRSGNYIVTLTGSYNNCILTSSFPVTILLKQNPTLSANKTEICSSDNLNVQIAGMETNPYVGNWEWGQYHTTKFLFDNGQEFTGSGMYNTWRFTSYNATLQNFTASVSRMRAVVSQGGNNCLDTTNYINLKVNGPIAGFKILNNDICYKTTPVIFEDTSKTATSTPIVSWQWNFGDATQTYQQGGKVSHEYKNPGGYYVNLTVRDASGCMATTPSKLVNAKGPKANFTASGLFVPNVPLNTTVNFYNGTYTNSNVTDYAWHYGDGATSNSYSGQHIYTQAGTDTVKLIARDPSINCADTAKQVIYVKDFNTAFTFSSSFLSSNNCPPVLVRINNLSVGAVKVVWDFGDGTTADNQFYPSHTYYQSGTYKITLHTYGYNGLTGTYIDSITVKEPMATIVADVLQGCTSQGVMLNATAQNSNAYSWDFGDGTIKSSTDVFSSHNYLSPGVYSPKLVMKSDNGCVGSAAMADKIVIDSLNIAIKGIPSYICDAAMINFTPEVYSVAETLAGQTLNYEWSFGTGSAADVSNIKNPSFAYTKPGTYTVIFKASSPYGCVKQTTAQVVIHERAKGSISGPLELCENGQASFKGSAVATKPVEWAWSFDNGNTAVVPEPSIQQFTTPRTYDIRLILKHDGCYDTTLSKLVVHPKPVISLAEKKVVVCAGSSKQLKASGGTIYSWSPAVGLNNSAVANPIASPLASTNYVLTVNNEFGCSNKDSVEVTVANPFKITAPRDSFVCAGSPIQLIVKDASNFKWINYTTGLNNTTIPNPTALLSADAHYTVVGYDAFGCFTDTANINIVVRPLPSVSTGPDLEVLANTTQQLQAVGSNDVVQWSWSPTDYLSCTNCASPLTTPKSKMSYVVSVKNQYGCVAADTIQVKIQCMQGFVYIPNTFTPNRDGKNDVFYIKGRGVGMIKSMKIFNRWGEMVFEKLNFLIDDRAAGWNGYFKGMMAPVGSYVYFAELQCEGEAPFAMKGTVTIVY